MANGWVIISGLIFIAGIGADCGCKVDDKGDPQKQEDGQKESCRDNRKIAGDKRMHAKRSVSAGFPRHSAPGVP